MKKNTVYLAIFLCYLFSSSHLFASVDDASKKNEFINVSFKQFIHSLEENFRVKVDIHGIMSGQNLVMKDEFFSLQESLSGFFKINNIKNSSFIFDQKDKIVRIWILNEYDGTKIDTGLGTSKKIVGKINGQIESVGPGEVLVADSSLNSRSEFTVQELEQVEIDALENSDSSLERDFTEDELKQIEDESQASDKSDSSIGRDFTEDELKQIEESFKNMKTQN